MPDFVESRRSFTEKLTFVTGAAYLSSLMVGAVVGGARGAFGGDRFRDHPSRPKMLANSTFNEAEMKAVSTAEKVTPRLLLMKVLEPAFERLVLTDWRALRSDISLATANKDKLFTLGKRLLSKPATEASHRQQMSIDFLSGSASALLFRWDRLEKHRRARIVALSAAGGFFTMAAKQVARV